MFFSHVRTEKEREKGLVVSNANSPSLRGVAAHNQPELLAAQLFWVEFDF